MRCTFHSAMSWADVFLATIWVSTRASLSDSFPLCRKFLLLDVVCPSWWYADITLDTVALDAPQILAVLVTDVPARYAPIICPLLNSDKSPIMSCALQYFTHSCAIAQLIQPLHSALTGRMCNQRSLATRLRKYSHVSSNTILASVSVSLSNPFTLNVYH